LGRKTKKSWKLVLARGLVKNLKKCPWWGGEGGGPRKREGGETPRTSRKASVPRIRRCKAQESKKRKLHEREKRKRRWKKPILIHRFGETGNLSSRGSSNKKQAHGGGSQHTAGRIRGSLKEISNREQGGGGAMETGGGGVLKKKKPTNRGKEGVEKRRALKKGESRGELLLKKK